MNRSRSTAARRFCLTLLLSVIAFVPGFAGAVTTLPNGFREEVVISGRYQPTAVRFAPNGQVFVAEKSGRVYVYDGVTDSTPTLVVDLRPAVYNFWDRGMLGLAIAPNYPAQPSIYVMYTHDAYANGTSPRWGTGGSNPSTDDPCPNPPGATGDGCVVYGRLSRIDINMGSMQGTEVPLLQGNWCQQYPSHSTGDLRFGRDGYLYASAGDGASFNWSDWGQDGNPVNPCGDPPDGVGGPNNTTSAEGGALRSQDIITPGDPTSFDGAILRLDVSGGAPVAPPDNPRVGNGVADDDFIIAMGLRNPFRFAQRPGTDEFWVSDVGLGSWEEINVIGNPAGDVENFGWPCYEGGSSGNEIQFGYDQQSICQTVYNNSPAGIVTTAPYWAYKHWEQVVPGEICGTGGSSITGIAFNTGTSYPVSYNDALFFADSTRQCIWTMFKGFNGLPNPSNIQPLASLTAGRVVDLQMGPDGFLYYADFDNGRIYRIRYFPDNQPPLAVLTTDVTNGTAPLTVALNGSGSSDAEDGTALQFDWDLDGDGQFDDATGASVSWNFNTVGVHVATLRVQDTEGATDTAAVTITAGNTPPVPAILSPTALDQWAVGDLLSLSGEAPDAQDGLLPPESLSWEIIMHHCYTVDDCHTHPLTTIEGTDSTTFTAEDHEYPSYLEFRLTAHDLPPPSWFDAAWKKRRRLTVDNSGQTETLNNLPVLVTLDASRIDYAVTAADGHDLRFTDADGNLLAHEIENWVPYGTSHVWVRAPQIPGGSTSTSMFMYYDNADAPAGADDPDALWSEYRAVWHLHGNAQDASVNANDGTVVQATGTGGVAGLALSFDGTSAWIDVPHTSSLGIAGPLTIEAWIGISNPGQSGSMRVVSKKSTATGTQGYDLEYGPLDNSVTSYGSGADALGATGVDLDTNWHYFVAVHDGAGAGSLFVDSLAVGTDATASLVTAGTNALRIGAEAGASATAKFSGVIDELRLAAVARSADWQRASYLAMTDQLLTYADEEQLTTLAATTSVDVYPRTIELTLASVPAGLDLTIGTDTGSTPFTRTVIVNSTHTVEAPGPQAQGSATYAFSSWSDTGAQQHLIAAPAADATLTAAYQAFTNLPPAVAVTSPAAGATLATPGVVPIVASAADAEDTVAYVEFYVDGSPIGTRTAAPWQLDWTATAGIHLLTVAGTDSLGASATSAVVAVGVGVGAEDDGDSDQMPDLWEAGHGLNWEDPADAGSDGDDDGLTALEEYQNGTDPQKPDTDGDGARDGAELRFGSDPLDDTSLPPDTDADGLRDHLDNCTAVANGPAAPDAGGNSQLDTDNDGYGNLCDADLNQDGSVNFSDLALFRSVFGTANANADLNGSGTVNFSDLALFRSMFGKSPGPSGLH